MSTDTETAVTTQVYRVYIKATPQAIWDAITKPEWNERFRLPGAFESTTCVRVEPSGRSPGRREQAMGTPEALAEGEVLEADPPRRLCPDLAVPL